MSKAVQILFNDIYLIENGIDVDKKEKNIILTQITVKWRQADPLNGALCDPLNGAS